MAGATVLFWVFETIAARQRFGRWDKYLILLRLKKAPLKPSHDAEDALTPQDAISRLDAFEKEQMKAKPILMWEVGLIFPVVFLYAAARGYMIVEVFVSLRALPAGAFRSFDLVSALPHW